MSTTVDNTGRPDERDFSARHQTLSASPAHPGEPIHGYVGGSLFDLIDQLEARIRSAARS